MFITIAGLSHQTAPIEVREKFFLVEAERRLLLSELNNDPSVMGAIVLSTCNRVEIYSHTLTEDSDVVLRHLFRIKRLDPNGDMKRHFYSLIGEDAVKHFLKVSTGVDSLILGEKQILGQIKEAIDLSRSMGMLSREFNILSNIAIRTGKKAQNETQINFGGSSISWAAVKMFQDLAGTLEGKSILVIGTGKMGRLAVNQFQGKGLQQLFLMNRTFEHSVELAREAGGIAVPFWDIEQMLVKVDGCICSTGCSQHLIDAHLISRVMQQRQGRKLVLVDISMPRNIDPNVAHIDAVVLKVIDDLVKTLGDVRKKREQAVRAIDGIVSAKTIAFYDKLVRKSSRASSDMHVPEMAH